MSEGRRTLRRVGAFRAKVKNGRKVVGRRWRGEV